MSTGRVAAKGAKVTLIGQWSKLVIQLGSTVLLARILAPSDFGLYSMIIALAGLATMLGDFGLSTASIQAKEISQHQRSNLMWLNIGLGVTVATIFFFSAGPIADFYGQPVLEDIAKVLAINFVLQSITTQFSANAARSLRFTLLSVADIAAQVVAFVVAIVLGLFGAGVWALVAQQLTVSLVTLVMITSTAHWLPSLPHKAPMRSLLTFGFNTFGVQVVNYLSSNVDSVVLGRVAGAQTLGFYDRAYQLFRLPVLQIASPMSRVAIPLLSRIQDDLPRINRYLAGAQSLIVYIVGAIFFVAAALSEPLIALVLGPGWSQSALFFSILAVGGLFQTVGYVYYWAFVSLGLTGLQLRYSLITRALMIGLIIACSAFGAVGVAVAVSGGLILNWVVLTLFPMRKTGLDVGLLVRSALVPLAVNLVVFVAVAGTRLLWTENLLDIVQLLIGGGVTLVIYAAAYFAIPAVRRGLSQAFSLIRKAV